MTILLSAVLVALFLHTTLAAAQTPQLAIGDSLTPSSPPLTSPSSTFTLSFRPFALHSSSSSLYLVISFATPDDNYPVWVANRDRNVSSSASLNLFRNGSLTLSDASHVVWTQPGVASAQLLDSGNLVLRNGSSTIIWQSFDYPTDTLLPGQRFGMNQNLTSQERSDRFKSGGYVLQFDQTGVAWLSNLLYDPYPATYWSWGYPSAARSSHLEYDEYGNFSLYSSGVVNSTMYPSDFGSLATRRLTLDLDGNLRMYSWNEASSRWVRVWLAFDDQCTRIMGLCGKYGICKLDPEPVCTCPQGFDIVDRADLSKGCIPTFPSNCTTTDYVTLDGTDFPYNDYFDIEPVSEEKCKSLCSSNCSCLAAVTWGSGSDAGHCWLKSQVLNGYSLESQKHRTFLKMSGLNRSAVNVSQTVNTTGLTPSAETVIKSLVAVIAVLLVGFIAQLAYLIHRIRKPGWYIRLHGDLELVSGSPISFSYKELEYATNSFGVILGSGGFGTVYKGRLPDGKDVAVKRLQGLLQREMQFRAEISTIGKIHHLNLVRLCGFCAEGEYRLLVYEYMENGSLDTVLFQTSNDKVLDWKTRFQICLGVARAITYLHEECLDCILHCDIKPQNILLDQNNRPKVADFGLAYLFSREHTVRITSIRGTRGYLAPEWVSNRPITSKADVFSYGMLLLEIVGGRSNYIFKLAAMQGEENNKWCFPLWAYKRKVEEVVDEKLGAEVDYEQAEAVLKVAFLCIQADPSARPSMGKVVQMLEGSVVVPEPPPPSLFEFSDPESQSVTFASSSAPIHGPDGSLAKSFLSDDISLPLR